MEQPVAGVADVREPTPVLGHPGAGIAFVLSEQTTQVRVACRKAPRLPVQQGIGRACGHPFPSADLSDIEACTPGVAAIVKGINRHRVVGPGRRRELDRHKRVKRVGHFPLAAEDDFVRAELPGSLCAAGKVRHPVRLPGANVGTSRALSSANVVGHLRQGYSLPESANGCRGEGQVARGRILEVAVQPAGKVVMNPRFPAFGLNAAMDEIVYDLGVRCPGSDPDASVPVLLRSPDGVVEDLDPVGIPQLDAAVRPTDNEVVANDPIGNIREPFASDVGGGLGRDCQRPHRDRNFQ